MGTEALETVGVAGAEGMVLWPLGTGVVVVGSTLEGGGVAALMSGEATAFLSASVGFGETAESPYAAFSRSLAKPPEEGREPKSVK